MTACTLWCVCGPLKFCLSGMCLRLIDSCITQLKAQGPSRTCNESKEEEGEARCGASAAPRSSVSRMKVGR